MQGDQPPLRKDFRAPAYVARMERYYEERVHGAWNGGHILSGRTPDADSILLMSNDYLALAGHPRIVRRQVEALLAQEQAQNAVTSELHQRHDPSRQALQWNLAEWLQAEATVLCQSGWCANAGLLQCIADAATPVYIDSAAHASLWEGACGSGAAPRAFRHNDLAHLERLVRDHGPGVVAVDALYSTHGDLCPLLELTRLAERHDCVLVLDESHSLGVYGTDGEGLAAALGLADRVHFRTASLGKAFAARAGIVTCSERFAGYFRSTASSAIFSSALLPHEIERLRVTLAIIRSEDWRRQRLRDNTSYLREQLNRLGHLVDSSGSQIIPLYAGTEQHAMALRDALEARGVFGSIFYPPATPPGGALVRLSVNAALTRPQLERVVDACRDVKPAPISRPRATAV